MTLSYSKGDIVFSCDSCPDAIEPGTSNFEAARNFLYREGWKAYKIGGIWLHKCDTCVDKPKGKYHGDG